MPVTKSSCCPFAKSISYVGDRWTLIILRDILLLHKTRFKEFKASREQIASNILSIRLKMLLEEGFIEILNPLGTKKKAGNTLLSKKELPPYPFLLNSIYFLCTTS